MASLRNTPPKAEADRDRYLDAARECLLDLGWRRTTLTEVSRRAGVSRMTIYRTWSDMPTLLGDLMTREWTQLVGTTIAADVQATPAGLADSVVAGVRALRENELFVRIVELDPELLLPYLLNRRGRSQELLADVLAVQITRGQEAGPDAPAAITDGDPLALARALLLAAHGFVFSAHTMVDEHVAEAAIDEQLHRLVERMLTP